MKKNLSRVLALALVLTSLLSLTVGAFADGTTVVIPNKISKLAAQLPEREAQPTVRTKTKNGEILVRVSGDPDVVYANWLGYGEEAEEVDLENGLGVVEIEGHKYQLGATWNNKVYREYYAYDLESNTWQPVDYYGTVKVGTTEMKIVTPATKDIGTLGKGEVSDMKYDAWVYPDGYISEAAMQKAAKAAESAAATVTFAGTKSNETLYPAAETEEETADSEDAGDSTSSDADPDKDTEEEEEDDNKLTEVKTTEGVIAAIPGAATKKNDPNTNGPLTGATVESWEEIGTDGLHHELSVIKDEAGYIIAINDRAVQYYFGQDGELLKDKDGNYVKTIIAEDINWRGMVPSYQFYEKTYGKESNGAPNKAWIVKKGPWTDTYTRAGKLVVITKDEENTDYFKTGIAGNTGKVIWQLRKTGSKWTWFVSEVIENYAEGDVAQAVADYNVNGELVRYYITYRTGENETYKIQYTPANKPAYGEYVGVDEFTGETIKAYSNSLKTWRDKASGKLTNQVELDWGLTALKDWTNPPRLTK